MISKINLALVPKAVLIGAATVVLAYLGTLLAAHLGIAAHTQLHIHGAIDGVLAGLAVWLREKYFVERALLEDIRRRH